MQGNEFCGTLHEFIKKKVQTETTEDKDDDDDDDAVFTLRMNGSKLISGEETHN